MKAKKKVPNRSGQKLQKRVLDARKNLERIQQEIAPYLKMPHEERVSTAGKWCETSALISDLCNPHHKQREEEVLD